MSDRMTHAPSHETTFHDAGKQEAAHESKTAIDWPYLAGGGLLVMAAIRGGLLRGVALSGAGAAVAYRGVKGHWPLANGTGGAQVARASLTINRPIDELFDLWSEPENMARLVPHVTSVSSNGDRSHWEADVPFGYTFEWDAEITRQERPHRIEWQTVEGSTPAMRGSVSFREATGNRGTEVRVEMTTQPAGGALGAGIANVLSKLPEQQVRRDLQKLKQRLEAGEIATTEGQPHGPRSPISITERISA